MKKKLQWGETPFHRMKPEELLRAAIKMYDACVAAKSALALCEINDKHKSQYNPFWDCGTGGGALEMCRQVVDPMQKKYGSENIWRAFYRPGVDLLWEDKGPIILTAKWAICPICGQMAGAALKTDQPYWGQRCADVTPFTKDCQGIMRPVTWDDMKINEPS